MANETEKTILPYLNVLEVETIDKSNVTKVIVIDKDDEVKVMDGSQLGSSNYQDLQFKPEINGVELNGNIPSKELGIPSIEDVDNQITEKLADYPTKEEVTTEITEATAGKQNTLVQGDGIVIEENTISADYNTIRNKPSLNGTELSGAASIVPAINIQSVPSKVTLAPVFGNQTGEAVELPIYNTETNQAGIVNGPLYAQLADKYTKAEIDAKLEEKQGVFTPQAPLAFNEDKSQLSVDLSGYQPVGDYALKSDIPTKISELTNDSNFVTEAEVSGDLAGKADKTYVDEQLATKQPVGDYATKTELAGKADSSVVKSLSTQVATNTSDISIIKTKQEEDGDKIDSLDKEMATKQDLLVSGTNIKTINSQSLLGEGNIEIESGSNIPFLFINSITHLSGNFAAVKNAIANKTPFELYYVSILGYGDIAAPEVCFASGENIQATFHFESTTANHTVVQTTITPTGVSADTSYHRYQEQLVSGTNIKTINGESILGEGNLEISGSGGTTDYTQLTNKPQINSVELSGNKSLSDLGIQPAGNYIEAGTGTQPQINTITVLTQSEYDDLADKDPNTQYLIVE